MVTLPDITPQAPAFAALLQARQQAWPSVLTTHALSFLKIERLGSAADFDIKTKSCKAISQKENSHNCFRFMLNLAGVRRQAFSRLVYLSAYVFD